MIEAITPAELQRRERIEAKLYLGAAQDLSDAEIERCLSGTCSPSKLIRLAKRLRGAGLLSLPTQPIHKRNEEMSDLPQPRMSPGMKEALDQLHELSGESPPNIMAKLFAPAPDKVEQFKKALSTLSHCRAGWDYELSREQRAAENKAAKEALSAARSIWAENPDMHDELRAAFKATSPLATMDEIERP